MRAPTNPGLTPVSARRIKRLASATVVLLALVAAVLSFAGLYDLALESEIQPNLAWLLPILIDGLVLTGSLLVIQATLVGVSTWYGWLLTWLGVIASVVGNIAAAPDTVIAQATHAAPPIAFALAVEGLLRVYRLSATVPAPEPRAPRPKPAPAVPAVPVASEPGERPKETVRERVRALLASEPDITGNEAARRLDIDPSHARKVLRELRGELNAPAIPDSPAASDR